MFAGQSRIALRFSVGGFGLNDVSLQPEFGLVQGDDAKIDRKIDSGFARIVLTPEALSDGVRHVLVLEPTGFVDDDMRDL